MDPALLPYLTVRMSAVTRHAWQPGDALLGLTADTARLWVMTEGEIHIRLPGGGQRSVASCSSFAAGTWNFILLPAGETREVRTPRGATWLSVGLTATLFGTVDLMAALRPPRVWAPDSATFALVSALLLRLVCSQGTAVWRPGGVHDLRGASAATGMPSAVVPERTASTLLLREGTGTTIFALLWETLEGGVPGGPEIAGIPRWLADILAHIAREPASSLASLVTTSGVSDVQMRRAFHRYLGVPPSDYLLRARLDTARRLLETTDATVASVAGRVGFESLSYFTRRYKRTFGHTPAQHRRLESGPVV